MIKIDDIAIDLKKSCDYVLNTAKQKDLKVYECEGEYFLVEEDANVLKQQISMTEPDINERFTVAEYRSYIDTLISQTREKDKLIFRLVDIFEKITEKGFLKHVKKEGDAEAVTPQKFTLSIDEYSDLIEKVKKEVMEETKAEEITDTASLPCPSEKEAVEITPEMPVSEPGPEKTDEAIKADDDDQYFHGDDILVMLKEKGFNTNKVRLRALKTKNKVLTKKIKNNNMYHFPSVLHYFKYTSLEGKKRAKQMLEKTKPAPKKPTPKPNSSADHSAPELTHIEGATEKEPEFISVKEIVSRLADLNFEVTKSGVRQLKNVKGIQNKKVGNLKLFNWVDIYDYYKKLGKI